MRSASVRRSSISGFGDVLEGLWVEVRHHEPDEDSDGDPRGRGCALYADCRYSLVEPPDLDRVFCILYEGQPEGLPRRGGAREPFAACALSCLMLGSPYPPGALEALARALDTSAVRLSHPTSPPVPAPREAKDPRGGGERGRCVGIWDGAGSETPAEGEPRWAGTIRDA